VDVIPWEFLPHDPFDDEYSAQSFLGMPLFALETGGTSLADFHFPVRGILIAGSEELGVSPRALAAADASLGRVSIPTWGAKGSLNVSGAFAIVMHTWAEYLAKLEGLV
jgi:TrmH family RNA methyltransferase